jgi:hypothetical protein
VRNGEYRTERLNLDKYEAVEPLICWGDQAIEELLGTDLRHGGNCWRGICRTLWCEVHCVRSESGSQKDACARVASSLVVDQREVQR